MPKGSFYVCDNCGYSQIGWAGKCSNCGTWGSLVETIIPASSPKSTKKNNKSNNSPILLSKVPSKKNERISTKIAELDSALGGGLVSGQVVLIAGEPGIGKSTLLLEVSEKLSNSIYIAGEESASQIKSRAHRLGIKGNKTSILEETDIDSIINATQELKPSLIIVDSIQTITSSDLRGMAGSIGQVRESAARLVALAKSTGTPVAIIGHVTKQGSVAGPAALAHIVDTVLWFEGEKDSSLRILRAFKNRFGPTDEIGVFAMQGNGLVAIDETDSLFISQSTLNLPGSCLTVLMEGTRPFLVEIQALATRSKLSYPKRISHGININKIELILAILTKKTSLPLYDWDIYVNAVGGITIKDPAADIAIALAIASSYFDKPLPKNLVAIGELGLLGETRAARSEDKRAKQARRQGYKNIVSAGEFPNIKDVFRHVKLQNKL